jgi:hypothetical protein
LISKLLEAVTLVTNIIAADDWLAEAALLLITGFEGLPERENTVPPSPIAAVAVV